MGKLFSTGIHCAIPSQRTIPASLLEPKVKNRNRIHYLMGNMEVSRLKQESWPLFLDPDGYVTEGAGCNFFIARNGIAATPEGRNILRGISRDYVRDILDDKCITTNMVPYDVYDSDEAFVTATPFCILPVVSLNGVQIGDGKPGELTKFLLEVWSNDVGVDIKKQIEDWDTGSPEGVTPYGFK